ncbi:MAG: helix-turn-helix domain-containing protein [Lachnospiraceae bacterium]|nr:helix-turn-helix domain-containing protein [Lachnospiraceae bacterium]
MIKSNMSDKTLGEYLRELRKSFGYSQEFVASHLNIIRQTYSHYETGRIIPPTETLFLLADLYKVSFNMLFEHSTSSAIRLDANTDMRIEDKETLSVFLEYVNDPQNALAFKGLNRNEKELLFLYQNLTVEDREDILDFMKIKYRRKRNKK